MILGYVDVVIKLTIVQSSPPRPSVGAPGTPLRRDVGLPAQPSFSVPLTNSLSTLLFSEGTPDRSHPAPIARPIGSTQNTPKRDVSDDETTSPGTSRVIGSVQDASPSRGRSFSPPEGTDNSGGTLEDSDRDANLPATDLARILRALEAGQRDFALVKIVLDALGLEKHIRTFQEQEIDFGMLMKLDDGDLRELGLTTMGARKKLIAATRELSNLQNRRANRQIMSTTTSAGGTPVLSMANLSSSAGTDASTSTLAAPSLLNPKTTPIEDPSPHSAIQAARTAQQSLDFVFADTSPDPSSELPHKFGNLGIY